MGELEPRQRGREIEGASYVGVASGLVLLLVAAAFFSTGISSGVFFFGFPFLFPAAWLFGKAFQDVVRRRRAIPSLADKESELLSAIRDNGGAITPAGVAIDTPLTVKEADQMLSGLAAGGHLRVEVEGGGTLSYALPTRPDPEIGG